MDTKQVQAGLLTEAAYESSPVLGIVVSPVKLDDIIDLATNIASTASAPGEIAILFLMEPGVHLPVEIRACCASMPMRIQFIDGEEAVLDFFTSLMCMVTFIPSCARFRTCAWDALVQPYIYDDSVFQVRYSASKLRNYTSASSVLEAMMDFSFFKLPWLRIAGAKQEDVQLLSYFLGKLGLFPCVALFGIELLGQSECKNMFVRGDLLLRDLPQEAKVALSIQSAALFACVEASRLGLLEYVYSYDNRKQKLILSGNIEGEKVVGQYGFKNSFSRKIYLFLYRIYARWFSGSLILGKFVPYVLRLMFLIKQGYKKRDSEISS